MADNAFRTALTAMADQGIAQAGRTIDEMVKAHRKMLAAGKDRTVATGILVMANLATCDLTFACQLLGVAVAKLAELPDQPDPLGGESR